MKQVTVIGIDLAKNVFQIHSTDPSGFFVLEKKLSRRQMIEFFAKLTPCLIGMETCGSSHHWARKLSEFGHTAH